MILGGIWSYAPSDENDDFEIGAFVDFSEQARLNKGAGATVEEGALPTTDELLTYNGGGTGYHLFVPNGGVTEQAGDQKDFQVTLRANFGTSGGAYVEGEVKLFESGCGVGTSCTDQDVLEYTVYLARTTDIETTPSDDEYGFFTGDITSVRRGDSADELPGDFEGKWGGEFGRGVDAPNKGGAQVVGTFAVTTTDDITKEGITGVETFIGVFGVDDE